MTRSALMIGLWSTLLLNCDDPPPQLTEAAGATPATASGPALAAPAGRRPAPRKQPSWRPTTLGDEDFVESIERNRDPFRSYLSELSRPMRRTVQLTRTVKMQRYALDELSLIAVVTGGVRPRAMFRDPKGVGVAVARGEYISKSAARVKQIINAKGEVKVIVELQEGGAESGRVADRVIELYPKREQPSELE